MLATLLVVPLSSLRFGARTAGLLAGLGDAARQVRERFGWR